MPMWLNLLRLTTSIAGRALITNQLLGSKYADVAQLAEQLICNQQVIGSSPIIGFVPAGAIIFGPLAQLVRATGS